MPTGQMSQGMTGVLASERGQNMPQPKLFGENILQGNVDFNREMVSPAVQGREPLPIDFLKSALKQSMLNRDYDNALKFQKAIQESEKTTNEYYGGLTEGIDPKTGQPVLLAMTKTGAVPSGYAPKPKDAKSPITWEIKNNRTITQYGYDSKGNVIVLGRSSMDAPVEPKTQPRQPRLQQVTDTTGTYIVDLDTGETRPILINGKPVAKPQQAPSGEESNAAGFLVRMKDATKLLDTYEGKGKPSVVTSSVSGIPFVGGVLERVAQTPEQQQYKNAALAWIRAKLRKESGAAIGKAEAEQEYQNYFPVVGDTKEVIAQKRSLRQSAMDEMLISSGKAAPKVEAARPTTINHGDTLSQLPPTAPKGAVAKNAQTGKPEYIFNGTKWIPVGSGK